MGRAAEALSRHGVAGAARIAAGRALRLVFLREEHVWYELDLGGERPRPALAPPLRLDREPRGAGADVWRVREGSREAFACFVFRDRTPVLAAPDGSLRLPERTVCLEDSATAPEFRGRGIAPAAWSAIADALAGEGVERIVTKVATANAPSRRAVEKAGFREVALQKLTRVGGRKRVAVVVYGGAGALLAERLVG